MSGLMDILPSLRDAERYVGMAYVADEFDCSDLVAQVQTELFGKTLRLPPHAQRPGGRAGRRRMISAMCEALATELAAPEHGAVIMMKQPADDGGGMLWHMGVMFAQDHEWWVLHNAQTLGSVWLHRLSELGKLGLQVEGYYACL